MKVQLVPVCADNRSACLLLKVGAEQEKNIASNEKSLQDALLYGEIARPFVIYADDIPIGFTMLAFDEMYGDPTDRYWLWRFMIDRRFQGKGYGRLALEQIIAYFRENGADHIKLSTKPENRNAISLYRKFGFQETGERNGEEAVFSLKL